MADQPSPGWLKAMQVLASPDAQQALAGAAGGLVRTLTLRDNWREGIANLVVGSLCAVYLPPLALFFLSPTLGKLDVPPAMIGNLSAFIMGLGGMTAAGFILDVIKAKRASIKGGEQ